MHRHSLQSICADVAQSVPQKLHIVKGDSAFTFRRLFCSCIRAFPPFQIFPSLNLHPVFPLKIVCPFVFLSGYMWPSNDFRISLHFHLSYCSKLSFQALSWIVEKWSMKEILFGWPCQDHQGDGEQGVGLRKLISKQDISDGKRRSLNTLNRNVSLLGGRTKSVSSEIKGWVSLGICLANRKSGVNT